MIQEAADSQACAEDGVISFTSVLNDRDLKSIESRFLGGQWMTMNSFGKLLDESEAIMKIVASSAHPPGRWSLLVPTRKVKALFFAIMRVPGLMPDLYEVDEFGEHVRVEKARAKATLGSAIRIAEALDSGEIKYHEELEAALLETADKESTREALKALKPVAPRFSDDGKPLASLSRDSVASSLPSRNGFRLRVCVKGGVNVVDGSAQVTIERSLDEQSLFREFRGLLRIKCPKASHQRLLLAAQLADEPVDVFLAAEIGVFLGRGVQRHVLTLVSVACQYALDELIRLAIERGRDLLSPAMDSHPSTATDA